MSRIGKLPISIPTGVTVTLKDNVVTVKGPKGELSQFVDPSINVAIEDGHVMLTENENAMLDNVKQRHAFHGLYRSLVNNMVIGVSEGYKKELELVGGQVCSKIRSFRKPEPYKGKGIKFVGEEIRRKSGKSAGAK